LTGLDLGPELGLDLGPELGLDLGPELGLIVFNDRLLIPTRREGRLAARQCELAPALGHGARLD
jgi:hypothetical protein